MVSGTLVSGTLVSGTFVSSLSTTLLSRHASFPGFTVFVPLGGRMVDLGEFLPKLGKCFSHEGRGTTLSVPFPFFLLALFPPLFAEDSLELELPLPLLPRGVLFDPPPGKPPPLP